MGCWKKYGFTDLHGILGIRRLGARGIFYFFLSLSTAVVLLWRDVTAVKRRRREGGHDYSLHNYLIPNKLPAENFHGKSHESDCEYR